MNDTLDSEPTRHYLSMRQDNITRMATNSANCKTWTITIVTALLALTLADKAITGYLKVLYIPVFLFYLLDSYYLSVEKRFRKIEEEFVCKAKIGEDTNDLLYSFHIHKYTWYKQLFYATTSISVWPFYLIIVIVLTLITL